MAQKGEELKTLLSAYANFDTKLQYAQVKEKRAKYKQIRS